MPADVLWLAFSVVYWSAALVGLVYVIRFANAWADAEIALEHFRHESLRQALRTVAEKAGCSTDGR